MLISFFEPIIAVATQFRVAVPTTIVDNHVSTRLNSIIKYCYIYYIYILYFGNLFYFRRGSVWSSIVNFGQSLKKCLG